MPSKSASFAVHDENKPLDFSVYQEEEEKEALDDNLGETNGKIVRPKPSVHGDDNEKRVRRQTKLWRGHGLPQRHRRCRGERIRNLFGPR